MPKGKTGDKTFYAHALARNIDQLLDVYVEKRLTPSERASDPCAEFLGACFDVIGVDVTPSAVIRRIAKERNRKVSAKNS